MLSKLETRLGYRLHPYVESVFTAFDGFAEGDFDLRSYIHANSIAEVLAFADERADTPIAFADVALRAQMLGCDLSMLNDAVCDVDTGEVFASGYAEFWEKLISNRLEF
jgi:hypothetical protein